MPLLCQSMVILKHCSTAASRINDLLLPAMKTGCEQLTAATVSSETCINALYENLPYHGGTVQIYSVQNLNFPLKKHIPSFNSFLFWIYYSHQSFFFFTLLHWDLVSLSYPSNLQYHKDTNTVWLITWIHEVFDLPYCSLLINFSVMILCFSLSCHAGADL